MFELLLMDQCCFFLTQTFATPHCKTKASECLRISFMIYTFACKNNLFYILFRNALICLGRQESEGNKTELTGGDKVLFSLIPIFEMFYFSNARSFPMIVFSSFGAIWNLPLPALHCGSRVGGGKPRSWAKAQFLSRPPVPLFFPVGVWRAHCVRAFAHGPMLLLLDSDFRNSPLQNEGVRVSANFLYDLYIRLQK